MKASFVLLVALVGLAPATHLNGQASGTGPSVTTPTARPAAAERDEAIGTITDVTPERSLVLHTGTSAGEPTVFRFAQQVTYVDEDGRVVEAAGLRKNLRVRISYVKAGADNVIEKVTILQ